MQIPSYDHSRISQPNPNAESGKKDSNPYLNEVFSLKAAVLIQPQKRKISILFACPSTGSRDVEDLADVCDHTSSDHAA